jgi:WD40 repeat protein
LRTVSVAISDDLVVTSVDKFIKLWDPRTAKCIDEIEFQSQVYSVEYVVVNNVDLTLVAASQEEETDSCVDQLTHHVLFMTFLHERKFKASLHQSQIPSLTFTECASLHLETLCMEVMIMVH